jgi:secreted trypsin-like serine protease
MMRRLGLFAMALLLSVSIVAPAYAITYGEPDAGRHPYVGALVAEFDGQKDWICSGTLISPTVFLTAAHCTAYLQSVGIPDDQVFVTFDEVFDPATSIFYQGTMYTNPEYPGPASDSQDIAVVVFQEPVPGITPAQLPTASLLDELQAKNGMHGQLFTAVGYGIAERTNGGGQPSFGPGGARKVGALTFNALNKTWLRLSQNPATGNDGACYGDSGGPNFLGTSNVIAAITITGDAVCRATNVAYRLDSASARAFLSQFVTLP